MPLPCDQHARRPKVVPETRGWDENYNAFVCAVLEYKSPQQVPVTRIIAVLKGVFF